MKTTLDFLDAISAKLGGASDYAIAKHLDVTRASVSKWRNGHGGFDDETAIRVARILDINPAVVLFASHAERTKTPAAKSVWVSLANRFAENFNPRRKQIRVGRSVALA